VQFFHTWHPALITSLFSIYLANDKMGDDKVCSSQEAISDAFIEQNRGREASGKNTAGFDSPLLFPRTMTQ